MKRLFLLVILSLLVVILMAGCTGYSNEAQEWNNKGVDLGKNGRIEEALAACDQALKIDPEFVEAWINKGSALNELGRHQEAIEAYDQALKIDPGFAQAKKNRDSILNYLKT